MTRAAFDDLLFKTACMNVRPIGALFAAMILGAGLVSWSRPGAGASAFGSGKVAVMVFSSQKELASVVVPAVRSRIEEILSDNSVAVLDKDQSERLSGGWAALEDPGVLITAEQLVEASERFGIDGVLRVYVNADVQQALGDYYSATAQVDLRYVKEDASTVANTTHPMGAPGSPPSDGLTQSAAVTNALHRAVDQSLEAMGLTITAPQSPRVVKISLVGPLSRNVPMGPGLNSERLNEAEIRVAGLVNKRWESEQATCTAKAPGGGIGVVGGLIKVVPRGDAFLHLGTQLHVLDLSAGKELQRYEIEPVSRRSRDSTGTMSIHDCAFLGGWRNLAFLTSNHVVLWDIERGVEIGRAELPIGIDRGSLKIYRENGQGVVVVQAGATWLYSVQAARR